MANDIGARPNPAGQRKPSRWLWLLTDAGIAAASTVIALLGLAVVALMWLLVDTTTGTELAKLRLDVLKFAFGVVAGAGAMAALLLAIRRQRHTETAHQLAVDQHALSQRAQTHTESDAAARRVTEQYSKSIEQLGSAHAAVRLGALYSLERLAQQVPDQRQTVVNVICAYLRMPYTLFSVDHDEELNDSEKAEQIASGQELQVRLAAQQILVRHLKSEASEQRWFDIDINLSSATLVDFDMSDAVVRAASFDRAVFRRIAVFDRAQFRKASFVAAHFTSRVEFRQGIFAQEADFKAANFARRADFNGTRFSGGADFTRGVFSRDASFRSARFGGPAWFGGHLKPDVTSAESASSGTTRFCGRAHFGYAVFDEVVGFADAEFGGLTTFEGARFRGDAGLNGAMAVNDAASGDSIWPDGWTVTSGGELRLTGITTR
ncbi:hypothetical protein AMIS_79840 [Actinoplanes missouriensis 431]|uniref:Pentapeptide repeat-containing protein n=1 Tax=Actinoplanes missouriensis (strain ATCC 14538 / DSM 43046 / CBS 188.64 / JCM 3121 / NBRC 102363 / NCIMB 12654 / NRRL B-3342 / UNCC 431) TaxID=512565 RepID=I0HJL7_ACTM4|nr:pentapeptide repeat-containing protein [Actinoplanes missouriensis]BAL93204.1 hypothetical protein AMIS_79840 [Actinoplanes missouriensis 431]